MILDTILLEYKLGERNGIYGLLQKEYAYNSSKIEGSRLSREQTHSLFDTRMLSSNTVVRSKDIEELTGHFVMFNTMLNTIQSDLGHNVIKLLHKSLKSGVFEDIANGYNIGEYKSRPNFIGTFNTTLPENVTKEMSLLLTDYNKSRKTLKSIAYLHSMFEQIHPFQDGNGRVGRMLVLRECLRNNIRPFIVRDKNKSKYISVIRDVDLLYKYFVSEQRYFTSTYLRGYR